jgi:probable HAF family extracellular repeat protein
MKVRAVVCCIVVTVVAGCGANAGGGGNTSSAGALPQMADRSGGSYYNVTNLGTFGGSSSSAASINETGWATGSANLAGDEYSQAALWRDGRSVQLGTLGGANSGVDWPNHNDFGLVAGISETAAVDPLGEDWSCQAFFPTVPDTKHVCLGFAWRDGRMNALPTLGGINGYAAGTNDLGEIVGWAETPFHDPTCSAATKFPSSFYQVLQFEPVVWDENGHVHRLPTLPGDPDGAATAINDEGQIVGISGTCDQAVGRFTAAHAVIWQDGRAREIPTFGGISWNTPEAINNRGEVAGFANLPGDTSGQFQPMGFVWSEAHGLQKILPLSGDTNTEAAGINDLGQVVGVSFNINTFAERAFIWENGKTMDLNAFLAPNSPYDLLAANDIDDRGDIVGQAAVIGTTQVPAFLAVPPLGWDPASSVPTRSNVSAPALALSLRKRIVKEMP